MQQREARKSNDLESTINDIGRSLAVLDPGALAELRRLNPENPTAPVYWRLVTRLDLRPEDKWAQIIQLMAILTKKGFPGQRVSPHDRKRSLGAALCDGLEDGWGLGQAQPRPMLSETRFARLLASHNRMRADLLRTTTRMLAQRESQGVNCTDLAAFILSKGPGSAQKLARDYYTRLDRAQSDDETSGDENNA